MKVFFFAVLAVFALSACDNNKHRDPAKFRETAKGEFITDGLVDFGNWFIKDPGNDKLEGVASERAIQDYALKNEKEIVVAVIDSGVDIEHEDLKGKIWENPGESGTDADGKDKSSNGIDDDGNGYVDDIHGWNFLGGADGKNIEYETLEATRELVAFEKRVASGEVLKAPEQAYFDKVKKYYDEAKLDADETLKIVAPDEAKATPAKSVLKTKLGLEELTEANLKAIQSTDQDVIDAKTILLEITKKYRSVERFYRIYDNTQATLNYHLNKSFNPRTLVGDDPNDFSQTKYGNNDVKGPDASHGTHVSGIIAAVRGNGIGIDGVAENVKIMALRVVPNGDERDKDIALAVRYAADNGAQIINMSFGKNFSPHKSRVDDAFVYAASKGVLIFHSAGNDSSNNDLVVGYPNRTVQDAVVKGQPEKISTWIEIGASAKSKGLNMVASFSDYGKVDVDIFSPGFELNSTIPDNKYAVYSGTSMASPAAAGTAALLMSNFADMTAVQAKAILLNQARLYPGLMVKLPGSAKLDLPVPFADLSATGGVIDALASVRLAKDLSGK